MKKFSIAFLALATALAVSPAAKADGFTFTFTGSNGVSGTGSLWGTMVSPGLFEITGGTGFFNDGSGMERISLMANPNSPSASYSPSGSFIYDDLLMPGQAGTILDLNGLLFKEAGGMELNLWGNGAGNFDTWYEQNGDQGSGGFGIAPTPEPGSLLLLGTGLFGLAFIAFRKSKPSGQMTLSV